MAGLTDFSEIRPRTPIPAPTTLLQIHKKNCNSINYQAQDIQFFKAEGSENVPYLAKAGIVVLYIRKPSRTRSYFEMIYKYKRLPRGMVFCNIHFLHLFPKKWI